MSEPHGNLLGREHVRTLLEGALAHSSADETEVSLVYERGALTRFADGYVHQNVSDETPRLSVRAVFGKRVGAAVTSRLDGDGIVRVVEQAEAIARLTPENERFAGLPSPGSDPGEAPFSSETARCSPDRRASAAAVACRLAREAGLAASGAVTTSGQEIAAANSHGIFAYTPRSTARITVVATGESGSGYAEEGALDLAALDMAAIAGRAVEVARDAQNPVEIAPGDYTVIMQPEAVSDITQSLAMLGFGARAIHEGRSFVAGKQGERVLGENITIWDDGRDPSGWPLPFDAEGAPRRRLSLIERGVAQEIATDTYYAHLLGRDDSGHAPFTAGMFNPGPIPVHMFMAPGEATLDEMIRSTERGLLITHVHYTRVVHPLFVIITGMTRDGTFLIENGEIARPVKNLRYTQSYLDALRDVQAIGRETRLCGEWVASRVPALKIGSFTFTGATQ